MGRVRTYPAPSRRKFKRDAGPPEGGVGVVLAFIASDAGPVEAVGF